MRPAARSLNWKTEVQLADGQTAEADENSLRIFRLARLYDDPSLIGFLIRKAVRTYGINGLYDGLASGDVSPELHDTIDQELARHDTQETLIAALNSERALSTGWLESTEMQQHYSWLFRVFGWQLNWYQAGSLDALAEYIHLAGQPWHEVRQQVGDSRSTVTETGHGILADLLVPAMRASFYANARSRAMVRSLRIYNALRRYAEEHGQEADSLADLGLPKEATLDPYSGEPLKLKRSENGWIVYSVMENGVDDGGDFREQKDYGVAPSAWRATQ
jgi:hypothetical protein